MQHDFLYVHVSNKYNGKQL